MRILVAHPGANWSTADVEAGLRYGLEAHGCQVVNFRLDQRLPAAHKSLHALWRQKRKEQPDLQKPNAIDVAYQASIGILEMALRRQVDAVIIVSTMLLHPDAIVMMKRAHLRVTALFTESPYDHAEEIKIAKLVDGGWTNERSVVSAFREVNSRMGYLPHGWHPGRHAVGLRALTDVPAHDVVFVGTGFPERVRWFNAIDWTGIDLGLYGTWKGLGLTAPLRQSLQGGPVENAYAAALYRRAKIGLNLYRSRQGWGRTTAPVYAESLSPRAYELAACGVFHLSENRPEVREVFGDAVPTFTTPAEAAVLIRHWLADETGRQQIAQSLPALVAHASWIDRAQIVLGDLQQLLAEQAA